MKTVNLTINGVKTTITGTEVSREKAIDMLYDLKGKGYGKFISAITRRREDSKTGEGAAGEPYKTTFRFGTAKGKSGGKQTFKPERRGLITCYSLQAKGYRNIDLLQLVSFTYEGTTYVIA